MNILIGVYIALLGSSMGSFAGAVAWRLYKGRDFVRERSECEHCHHVLGWYDLIPVVSWLQLGGRCRYCHRPIGTSALLLELGTAASFVLSFAFWPFGWSSLGLALFIAWLVSLVLLTILFIYDLRHSLLPDVLVWPLAVIGLAMFCMKALLEGQSYTQWPLEALLALLPITGVYGLLNVLSRGRWIGLGDVKLGLFIGLALGWQNATLTLFLANYLGFFWVIPGMVRGKFDRNARMPFGPFLILATFIAFLWGSSIMAFVLGSLA